VLLLLPRLVNQGLPSCKLGGTLMIHVPDLTVPTDTLGLHDLDTRTVSTLLCTTTRPVLVRLIPRNELHGSKGICLDHRTGNRRDLVPQTALGEVAGQSQPLLVPPLERLAVLGDDDLTQTVLTIDPLPVLTLALLRLEDFLIHTAVTVVVPTVPRETEERTRKSLVVFKARAMDGSQSAVPGV